MEEDDQEFSYSVRLSAHDLLQAMWAEPSLSSHTHSAIVGAVQEHLQTTAVGSSPHGWKVGRAGLSPSLSALKCTCSALDAGSLSPSAELSCRGFWEDRKQLPVLCSAVHRDSDPAGPGLPCSPPSAAGTMPVAGWEDGLSAQARHSATVRNPPHFTPSPDPLTPSPSHLSPSHHLTSHLSPSHHLTISPSHLSPLTSHPLTISPSHHLTISPLTSHPPACCRAW